MLGYRIFATAFCLRIRIRKEASPGGEVGRDRERAAAAGRRAAVLPQPDGGAVRHARMLLVAWDQAAMAAGAAWPWAARWRFTADSTARNEAVTMLLSMPAPNRVWPFPTRSST